MTGSIEAHRPWRAAAWRLTIWGTAASLLLLPWAAMQFTAEVTWTGMDFVVWGAMLLTACAIWELTAAKADGRFYRAAVAVAIVAAFLLVWINLAVGIIGSEQNSANLLFAAVLAVAIGGAFMARFRARGMARAFVAVALAQALVAPIALIGRMGIEGAAWPRDVLAVTGFFTLMRLLSAWLFRQAARAQAPTATA